MNELALFAGAGGGILAGHLNGWRCICAVERDAFCAQLLAARQNDGALPPFPIWSDVCSFDGRPWRGLVDVVSGGFPCQDISAAGKGAGIDGARSGLWREMARIIGEVLPRDVFVENTPLLVRRGIARVIADLAQMGHDAHWCCLSASGLGAPHQRDRFWLVAHPQLHRLPQRRGTAPVGEEGEQPAGVSGDVPPRLPQHKQQAWFPTPTASQHKGWSKGHNRAYSDDRLDYTIERQTNEQGRSGRLNPQWVEWLMGWPIGWTDLLPLATDRFQEWQQQHSNCSATPAEFAKPLQNPSR